MDKFVRHLPIRFLYVQELRIQRFKEFECLPLSINQLLAFIKNFNFYIVWNTENINKYSPFVNLLSFTLISKMLILLS